VSGNTGRHEAGRSDEGVEFSAATAKWFVDRDTWTLRVSEMLDGTWAVVAVECAY
jgi:hypothetical protein